MKKRILFVIESLNCGGAEKSFISLIPLINKNKYEIHIWIIYKGGVFEKFLSEDFSREDYKLFKTDTLLDKIRFAFNKLKFSSRIRVNNFLKNKRHGAEIFYQCMNSSFKIHNDKYDIAIAYQQGIPTYLLPKHINADRKISWINVDIFSAGYNSKLNYYFYKKSNSIVAVSDLLSETISCEWPDLKEKIVTVYDILNPNVITFLSNEKISDFNFKDEKCILTVGRLAKQKGYDLLLDAALILKNRNVSYKWYIIGEGAERKNIELYIKNHDLSKNVILLGLKENPYPYMKACDIYVQTSKFEGFGLTIGEAKILQKPIVSTNFDVVYNQITNNINGIIVNKDGVSIANGIMKLLNNPDLVEQLQLNLSKEKNTTHLTEYEKIEKILDEN